MVNTESASSTRVSNTPDSALTAPLPCSSPSERFPAPDFTRMRLALRTCPSAMSTVASAAVSWFSANTLVVSFSSVVFSAEASPSETMPTTSAGASGITSPRAATVRSFGFSSNANTVPSFDIQALFPFILSQSSAHPSARPFTANLPPPDTLTEMTPASLSLTRFLTVTETSLSISIETFPDILS